MLRRETKMVKPEIPATFQKVVGSTVYQWVEAMGTPRLTSSLLRAMGDIYKVADVMKDKGDWELARMQRPPCLHVREHSHGFVVGAW